MKEHIGSMHRQSYLIQHMHFKRLFEDNCLELRGLYGSIPRLLHKSLLLPIMYLWHVYVCAGKSCQCFSGNIYSEFSLRMNGIDSQS